MPPRDPLVDRPVAPRVIVALGLLAALAPLSTDLYLPAFPGMAAELGVEPFAVQLTLTGFLLGLGAGPLVAGPLSDRLGRRPVLLLALALFVACGIGMSLTGHLAVLVGLRVAQGLGASAAIVLSRVVAADLWRGSAAVRAISFITLAVGVGAVVAAPTGAAISGMLGWRGALGALAAIGAAVLLVVAIVVPESLPLESRSPAGRSLLRPLLAAARTPSVLPLIVALGAAYAAMMSFISASPFVGMGVLGLSPGLYAVAFAGAAVAMLTASLVNAAVGPRAGARRMLAIGQALLVGVAIVSLVLSLTGAFTVVAFVVCGFLLVAGTGFTMINVASLVLEAAAPVRGSAGALMSTGQYLFGAAAAPLVGLGGTSTTVPLSIAIAAWAAISATAVIVARRRPATIGRRPAARA